MTDRPDVGNLRRLPCGCWFRPCSRAHESTLTPAEVREAAARIVMGLAIEEEHLSEKAHLISMPEAESQHWRAYLALKDAAAAIRAMPLTRPEGQP